MAARHVNLLLCVWFWSAQLTISFSLSEEPLMAIVVPQKVRFGQSTLVLCSASGVMEDGSNVTLTLRDGFEKEPIFQQMLFFKKDGVQNVTFTLNPGDVRPTSDSVALIAEGSVLKSEDIKIARDSGYILVQTDKPLYTPTQTVKYRVMAVDEDQRWAPWPIHLDVVSPNGIIVDQLQHLDPLDAFSIKEYHLHEHCMLGTWRIEASFKEEVQLTTSSVATFEVKEYVLPKFSVHMTVSPLVVSLSTTEININMSAEYVFGDGIAGEADIRIGVKQGNTVQRLKKLYHAQFVSGKAEISINTSDLSVLKVWFPKDLAHLYVEANVTDDGYGIMKTVSSYNVSISNTAYIITMDGNQKYFLPNKPFMLKGRLTTSSGMAAPKVTVKVIGTNTSNGELLNKVLKTDAAGVFQVKVTLPEDDTVIFDVVTVDKRYKTQATYLHVVRSLPKSQILLQEAETVDSRVGINIGYASTYGDSHMTVIVESRGHVVYTDAFPMVGTDMRTITFPPSLHKELSPHATVSAFYTQRPPLGQDSMLVMNTITLDVPDECIEELSLKYYSRTQKTARESIKRPGDKIKFWLEGTNSTRVGLVAVDKSVYLQSGNNAISRSSLFEYLRSHSLASGSDSGLKNTGYKTWTASGFMLTFLEERKMFDLPILQAHSNHAYSPRPPSLEAKYGEPISIEEEFDTVNIPPRVNFRETCFFENVMLTRSSRRRGSPKSIKISQSYRLPDSLTTWTIQAVGVSSGRGVCVSNQLDVIVSQPFFVDLLVPYKAVRLESVKFKLSLFNSLQNDMKIKVKITVPEELCLVQTKNRNKHGSRVITYRRLLGADRRTWKEYVVVPLKAGHYNITVTARGKGYSDAISKAIYVVPEGRPVSKTVTFQLDPSALMVDNNTMTGANVAQAKQGETIKTTWDRMRSEQTTVIDMALPTDTIAGTSHSNIYAYGDLLGDVVNSLFLESLSLMEDSESGGRKVLGDLAPAVYTLQYLQNMGLLTHDLKGRGKKFVKEGVAQLLTYKNTDGSFTYHAGKAASTWFTAAVLQTLCLVKDMDLTFVDTKLIDNGSIWLLNQIEEEGDLSETEARRKGVSENDADVILASEALLCILQCEGHIPEGENQDMLKLQLWTYLEDNLENVSSSLALAKISLALKLVDSEYADVAVKNLNDNKRNTSDGIFWSDRELDVGGSTSALYKAPVDAQSVEATSFALMTLLETGSMRDVRPIVTWLVQQRGKHGAFVGAMDTWAATHALAKYSLQRQSIESDLHCNITSHQSTTYLRTVDFSQQESIIKKGVSGVPTGEVYQFDSRGSRLGQMQIETGYNVAVGKNDHCPFNLTVTRKPFISRSAAYADVKLSPLCNHCNFACTDDKGNHSSRPARSARKVRTHSANILCVEVCLSPLSNKTAYNVRVDTGLLSGYEALTVTEKEMALMTNGRASSHRYKDGVFTVELGEVPGRETTCFGLHAKDESEVKFQQPAIVTVKEEDQREPSCSIAYDVSDSSVTLPVFCSNPSKRRKGVCMCTSGTCGKCLPSGGKKVKISDVREMLCDVDYVYEVQTIHKEKEGAWYHQSTDVLTTPRLGRDHATPGQTLSFSTPLYCDGCPYYKPGLKLYIFGKNAERLMDTAGTERFRYVVDDSMIFFNVTTDRNVNQRRAVREHTITSAIRRGCNGRK